MFQVDKVLIAQIEHEKCLRIIFLLNVHIVPTLLITIHGMGNQNGQIKLFNTQEKWYDIKGLVT